MQKATCTEFISNHSEPEPLDYQSPWAVENPAIADCLSPMAFQQTAAFDPTSK